MKPTHFAYCTASLEKIWGSPGLYENFCSVLGTATSIDPILAYEGDHGSILRISHHANLLLKLEDLVSPTEEEAQLLTLLSTYQCYDSIVVRCLDENEARDLPLSEIGHCDISDFEETTVSHGSMVLRILRYQVEE